MDILQKQIEQARQAAAQVAEQAATARQAAQLPALERQAGLRQQLAEAEAAQSETEARLRERLTELQTRGATIRARFEFVVSELAELPAAVRAFMADLHAAAREMGAALKRCDDIRRALAGSGPERFCPFDPALSVWKSIGGMSDDLRIYPEKMPSWLTRWRDDVHNMPIGYSPTASGFRRILY